MGNKKWQLNVTPTDKKKLSEKNFEEKTHEELSMEAKDKYAKLSASEKAIKQTTFEGYSEEDVSKLSELFSDKNRFLAISIKTTGFSKGNKPMLVDITGYTFDEEKGEYTLNDSNKYYIYDKGYEFEKSARFDSFKSNGIDESDYLQNHKTIEKTSEILNKLFDVAGEKNIPVLGFAVDKSVKEPLAMLNVSLDNIETIDVRNAMVYENAKATEVLGEPLWVKSALADCYKYYTGETLDKFTDSKTFIEALSSIAVLSQGQKIEGKALTETAKNNIEVVYGREDDTRSDVEKDISALNKEVENVKNAIPVIAIEEQNEMIRNLNEKVENMQEQLSQIVSALTTISKAVTVERTVDKTEKDKMDKGKIIDKKDFTGHEEETVEEEIEQK